MTTGSDQAARSPSGAWSRLRIGQQARDVPADHEYIGALGWFRVWRRGTRVAPLPKSLSAAARTRRRFAERLADSMAYPGSDRVGGTGLRGHDFDTVSRIYVPVAASELAQRVIGDAAAVTEAVMGTPGETRVYHGGEAMDTVVLVHGPDWSLVFEINAFDTVIRVCGDDLGDTAMAIDEDPDREIQSSMLTMTYDVLFQLQRMSIGGDLYDPDWPGHE